MTNTTVNAIATTETRAVETILTLRETVVVEIRQHLENIGATYIRVGSLLNEVRGDFEGQKDFLAWVEVEFSIKKAQCYNLMNVAKTFEGNEAFKSVAMRVMLALVPHADNMEVMEKAAEMATAGTLDTAAVNELTGKPAKPVGTPVVAGIEQAKAAQEGAEAAPQALQTVPAPADTDEEDDSAPFDLTVSATVAHSAPVEPSQPVALPNEENERTNALLATIKQLNETIAEMQATINARTSEREARKSAAPMLSQFKSKCMYARLGLSAEDAEKKTAVKKAQRELVKAGYGEGHDAWSFITEAVTSLIGE